MVLQKNSYRVYLEEERKKKQYTTSKRPSTKIQHLGSKDDLNI